VYSEAFQAAVMNDWYMKC